MPKNQRNMQIRDAVVVSALLLLAFGLRVYRLDGQSLWHDEGLSLDLASQSVRTLLSTGSSLDHPPLYFLILHFWLRLVGSSDFSIRALSLFMSLPVVPLLYILARRWTGRWAATATALLAAVSPLYLYYAQEARMYALATTLTMGATVILLSKPTSSWKERWLRWLAYGLCAAGALLSHYTAALVLGVHFAYVAAGAVRSRREWNTLSFPTTHLRGWLAVEAVLMVGGGLWLALTNASSSIYPRSASGSSLPEIARSTLVSYISGHGLEPIVDHVRPTALNLDAANWAAVGSIALAALGLIAILRTNIRYAGFLLAYVLLPVVGIYVLAAGRHDFTPRYLMVSSPAYMLLLGATLAFGKRTRVLACVLLAPLLGIAAWSMVNYYTDAAYQRDDFRALTRYILDQSFPGDLVVLNAGYTYPVVTHYLGYVGQSMPWVGLPVGLPPDQAATERQLEEVAARYHRAWLVLWQDYYTDPTGIVKGWLEKNGWQRDAHSFPGLSLYMYTLDKPVLSAPPAPQHALSADLGQTVELLGYDLDESAMATQGRLRATLYWRALTAPKASLNVFVHLVNGEYRPVGATDHRPAGDRLPTDVWEPGMLVRDEYELQVAAGTAPGDYRLIVGMYDPTNWQYLKVNGTEHTSLTLQTVKVDGR
ncbi:MAG: hypothetical protein EPO21_20045 [Chloroflexota bacterium]|nr:MAG: hypothetical protein EPO21_20045 [Chloroflexota bacterium]